MISLLVYGTGWVFPVPITKVRVSTTDRDVCVWLKHFPQNTVDALLHSQYTVIEQI